MKDEHHAGSTPHWVLPDEAATVAFGSALAQRLPEDLTIHLVGDLGAGKTTLVRGLLRALGYTGAVRSPTYTLVEPYVVAGRRLYHFDLYRLGDAEELEYIGIRDYFADRAIRLLEWPSRGAGLLPPPQLLIQLDYQSSGRRLSLFAGDAVAATLIANLRTDHNLAAFTTLADA